MQTKTGWKTEELEVWFWGGLTWCCVSMAFVPDELYLRALLGTKMLSDRDLLRLLYLAAAPTAVFTEG